jgi:hypothetical protein
MTRIDRWKRSQLLESLEEFSELYATRPIKDNGGGMKSPHMFPSWFVVKKLKPKVLIESGVWKGQGTWFFEKASPETKIISIDPVESHRVYTSINATYQTEDFLVSDWSHLPKEDTFVFFDDHQNCLPRIKKCHELGFKKIMVEDNYAISQGDCYTPKKILSGKDYIIDSAGLRTSHKNNKEDLDFFNDNVLIYQEMPPIFSSPLTRWGDDWHQEDYNTLEPLLTQDDAMQHPELFKEKLEYTWICYMELK